jgi:uncharacterized membrane protein HdeD (DUF308 family)
MRTGEAIANGAGTDVVRNNWGWFVAIGVVLVVLGVVALGSAVLATLASVFVVGWTLVTGGIVLGVHALVRRQFAGSMLDLVSAVLFLAVGLVTITHPLESAIVIGLVMAVLLVVHGLFRIAAGLTTQLPHRGWVLLQGVITLALGIWLWSTWPDSALWMLGIFVGVALALDGIVLAILGISARTRPPRPHEERREAPPVAPEAPAHGAPAPT